MKYSFESYVRYSEIGEDRNLTLNSVINYFQDCSTFHSEHTGVGIDYLQEKNRVWVLSSWQIVVDRYPKLCEKIKITTWPYAFKRFLGSRNFTMEDESGATVAYANSLVDRSGPGDRYAGKCIRAADRGLYTGRKISHGICAQEDQNACGHGRV